MAPHSNTLAWKIPWTEEPGRLQSMGSLRVGHDWATSLSLFTFMHWRKKWQPLQCSCLENPRDGGAWWAAVYGVAQSQTRLKRLSSSSSSSSSSDTLYLHDIFHLQSTLILIISFYSSKNLIRDIEKILWLNFTDEGRDILNNIANWCQCEIFQCRTLFIISY